MSKKHYTPTSGYLDGKKPIAVSRVHDFFNLQGRPSRRLTFSIPTPKLPTPSWDLAHRLRHFFPPNVIYFPDTNFFTKKISPLVWEAMLTKRIAITPMVAEELQPWLTTPFHNKWLRDIIIDARQRTTGNSLERLALFNSSDLRHERIIFLDLDEHFLDYAYQYYFDLLSIRRLIGLEIAKELEAASGKPADEDTVNTELMRRYGDRGLRVGREAFAKAKSPTFLADEQMIVMAGLTAILSGHETALLTWDTAIQEQHHKLWQLIDADYVAHWSAEWAAQSTNIQEFQEVRLGDQPNTIIGGENLKMMAVYRDGWNQAVLPQTFHPVFAGCLLIGGETRQMVVTPYVFCAEKEIKQLLRIKVKTEGKNTDRFGDCDCCMAGGKPGPDGRMSEHIFIFQPVMTTSCGVRLSAIDCHSALLTTEAIYRVVPSNIILP